MTYQNVPHFEKLGPENTWMYDSGHPGETVAILGGVHGDELAGPRTIRRVMDQVESRKLPVEEGRLIIIEGNPEAVKKQKRASTPGENLNRDFKELTPEQAAHPEELTYEQKRAQELMPLLDEADEALDLHEHHQPEGVPFIIGESNTFVTARKIGAPYIAAGFSKTEPGGSDGYMAEHGKPGLCFELGYVGDTQENVGRGLLAVRNFLGANGLVDTKIVPVYEGDPVFVHARSATKKQPKGQFRFARSLNSFSELKPGEIFAADGDKWYQAEPGDYIIFPNPMVKPGEEAFNVATHIKPDNIEH